MNLSTVSGLKSRDAIQFAAVEHHLREAGEVIGGGEQPRMASNAAHVAGCGVMHDAAQDVVCPRQPFGGRDARE